VDLCDIARAAVHDAQPAADRRNQQLALSVPHSPVAVCGHRESLSRLVVILLDNAVKYTPAGGSILIRISTPANGAPAASAAMIEVVDSGPGISGARPLCSTGSIGAHFARESGARRTGLGLSIARTIALRHGGNVWVTDPASGGRLSRREVCPPLDAASRHRAGAEVAGARRLIGHPGTTTDRELMAVAMLARREGSRQVG
jgi:signal transduction histidine kinase